MSLTVSAESLPTVVSIDLPMFTKSVEKSFEILGGQELVRNAVVNHSQFLGAKFPQSKDDPLRSSVLGKREQSFGLVLRLRRKRNPASSEDKVAYDVIGKTTAAYKFNQPIDYQFLPGAINSTKDLCSSSVVEIVPRPFAISHSAHQQNLGINLFLDSAVTQDHKNTPSSNVPQMVKFGDPVPQGPIQVGAHKVQRGKNAVRVNVALALLEELFRRIPVRLRRYLEEHPLLSSGHHLFTELVPRVAYTCISGPFKGLLIRYGYDPAENPQARFFQSVAIRIKTVKFSSLVYRLWQHLGSVSSYKRVDLDTMTVTDVVPTGQAGLEVLPPASATSYITMCCFGITLKASFLFQICAITDPSILEFMRSQRRLEQCNSIGSDGWFSATVIALLRRRIQKVLFDRVSEFCSVQRTELRPVAIAASASSSSPSSIPPLPRHTATGNAGVQSTSADVGGIDAGGLGVGAEVGHNAGGCTGTSAGAADLNTINIAISGPDSNSASSTVDALPSYAWAHLYQALPDIILTEEDSRIEMALAESVRLHKRVTENYRRASARLRKSQIKSADIQAPILVRKKRNSMSGLLGAALPGMDGAVPDKPAPSQTVHSGQKNRRRTPAGATQHGDANHSSSTGNGVDEDDVEVSGTAGDGSRVPSLPTRLSAAAIEDYEAFALLSSDSEDDSEENEEEDFEEAGMFAHGIQSAPVYTDEYATAADPDDLGSEDGEGDADADDDAAGNLSHRLEKKTGSRLGNAGEENDDYDERSDDSDDDDDDDDDDEEDEDEADGDATSDGSEDSGGDSQSAGSIGGLSDFEVDIFSHQPATNFRTGAKAAAESSAQLNRVVESTAAAGGRGQGRGRGRGRATRAALPPTSRAARESHENNHGEDSNEVIAQSRPATRRKSAGKSDAASSEQRREEADIAAMFGLDDGVVEEYFI